MFEKIFHTASYKRKLPVPFFEVLDQEYAALTGGTTTNFSWDFAADRLKQTEGLVEKIRPLFPPKERGQIPANCSKEELAEWLNKLLHLSGCLYDHHDFPKGRLSKEIIAMTGIHLDASELTRLNRLLLEEAFPEHLRKIADIHLDSIFRRIHAGRGMAALCFSGGGIRSATFALGVAQGLAKRGLMKHFDYLSTVSGGGYIGSWLSSWIYHAGDSQKVFEKLKGGRAESVTEPEPGPIDHLRKYSNFLTPRLGLFSADTWVLVSTYLRNLLLNWLVFVPILFALFAVPRVYASLLNLTPPDWVAATGFFSAFVLLALAMTYGALNRPAVANDLQKHANFWFLRRTQSHFLYWGLFPLCASAICATTAWSWMQRGTTLTSESPWLRRFLEWICGEGPESLPKISHYCLIGAILHLISWCVAELFIQRWRSHKWTALRWEFFLAIVTGALGGAALWIVAVANIRYPNSALGLTLYGCFAAPVFLGLFLVAATVFIGVSSGATSDEDREWWARMGAWILIATVSWSMFGGLVLFGAKGLLSMPKLLGAVGGISGLFTLFVGHSIGTSGSKEQKANESMLSNVLDKILSLAAPISIAALVAGLSLATSELLVVIAKLLSPSFPSLEAYSYLNSTKDFWLVVSEAPWGLTAGFFLVCAVAGWGLSRFINVNKFSLHSIYRSRLVRAYLGASNPKRDPNPFTGFDPGDNLPLQELRDPIDPRLPQRPLHIVNMALNLVTGDNLAWQQRKAETFTASTLHCGNFQLGYRFTKHYGQNFDGNRHSKHGLSLGTAMAISGAAASPNQGYHSSPTVALLMTLFNVRLGWWLGNPGAMGHKTFRDSSPSSPVHYMVKEGLGLTDGTSAYAYLSDGGHFENLGVYEMVLRRCRLIVVSDAGCDSGCSLEDLGNAIRKIRVDLGVKIDLKKFEIFSRNDEQGKKIGKYCAVGEIDYSAADRNGRKGILIYLKPALLGSEPRDIYNYSRCSEEFPHESTGDQWFSESQFESYRALGSRVIDWIYSWKSASIPDSDERAETLNDFIKQALTATESPQPSSLSELFENEISNPK